MPLTCFQHLFFGLFTDFGFCLWLEVIYRICSPSGGLGAAMSPQVPYLES